MKNIPSVILKVLVGLSLSVLVFNNTVSANTITYVHSVYTDHLSSYEYYNEDNDLKGIEVGFDGWGLNISKFDNSYYKPTTTIGAYYRLYDNHNVQIDALYGAVKGYTSDQIPSLCSNDTCLYVAPRIAYNQPLLYDLSAGVSVQLFGKAVVSTVGITYAF